MTNPSTPEHTQELLSVSEAARLTGQPKAYLRELIESGRLAVHLRDDPGTRRRRLSRQTLAAAGLLREAGSAGALAVEERIERLEREQRELRERLRALEARRAAPGTRAPANDRARTTRPLDGRLPLPVRPLPFPLPSGGKR